jgi:hypothetical protein
VPKRNDPVVEANGAEHPAPTPPVVIHPTGVYQVAHVRAMLGLRQSSLRREIREGRLRVNKRCAKYFFLGQQLLDWLAGGEMKRRVPEQK